MFDIIKSVISDGGYKLTEIQHKIKKLYMLGDLTEAQMEELLALASGGVSTDAERPETLKLIQTLSDKITALEDRVKALEGSGDDEEHPEHPAWKPWDGISSDYQKGSVVSHNGKFWLSVLANQNVWEPGTVGEDFWIIYNEAM